MIEKDRPRVFIGSSSEGARIAESAIQANLADTLECTVWTQGIFELGQSTLANLYSFLDKFDFAIFIVTPDDRVEIRGSEFSTARDNVIFEIGLFMGGLGVSRAIFVSAAKFTDFRLPSNLAGITHITYEATRSDGNISAAIGPACFRIKEHIEFQSHLPMPTRKHFNELTHAGAICFRRGDAGVEYLLVKSTRDRRIFPKGDVKRGDPSAMDAAKRVVFKEAGARGRIIEGISRYVNYFNEEAAAVHRIEVFLFDTTQITGRSDDFREPTWYNLNQAITVITKQRDYNTSYELARLIEWAEDSLRNYFDDFNADRLHIDDAPSTTLPKKGPPRRRARAISDVQKS